MATVMSLLIGLVLLAWVVWRRGPVRLAKENRRGVWLMRAAMAVLGLFIVFLLLMGTGEVTSGDLSGLIHVAPAVAVALIAYLASRRPREGGWTLVAIGLLNALYWGRSLLSGGLAGVLIMAAPLLLAGLLLVLAGHGLGSADSSRGSAANQQDSRAA